jgi:hypothetical protein
MSFRVSIEQPSENKLSTTATNVTIELPYGQVIVVQDLDSDIVVLLHNGERTEAIHSVMKDSPDQQQLFPSHEEYPIDPPTVSGTEITRSL